MIDYKNVTAKTESISAWDYIGAVCFIILLIAIIIL
jgi:hypothetical protein